MMGITVLVKKCNLLQEWSSKLEGTLLQSKVAELKKELGSSFKSSTKLKKKNDELTTALSIVHKKYKHRLTFHTHEVEKNKSYFQSFRDELKKTREELTCAKVELAVAEEARVVEYKESGTFIVDLSFGNVEAMEISFSCLYDKVAHDFLSIDLSQYTLLDLIVASTFEDDTHSLAFLDTPNLFDPHSFDVILPTIPKDQPFETEEAEVELDAFEKKLNGVLTMNEDNLKDGEIVNTHFDL